jgi:murein DD-endopeptidase MepM/ murein hydrolase activator NlpD
MERLHSLVHNFRFPFVGLLMVAGVLFLSVLVSTQASAGSPAYTEDAMATGMYDGPNAVTGSLSTIAIGADRAIDSADRSLANAGRNVQSGLHQTGIVASQTAKYAGQMTVSGVSFVGRAAVGSVTFVGRGIQNGLSFTAHSIMGGMVFVASIPGNTLEAVTDAPVVSAVIKPADKATVPTIDGQAPVRLASTSTLSEPKLGNQQPAAAAEPAAAWPLHGAITTLFGVPHWPFQPTHTGIDISDGQGSGISPIKPFKPGRVIEVVHSGSGLGNHVVIDHSNGLTSVYGHLYSTAVQVGQTVDMNTTLGLEGSTGASTGTHLHFEIRVNGQPVNPMQYVSGQP